MSDDPLSFSASLDAVYADAERIKGSLTLTIRNGNQFWFVLPDGILPNDPKIDISISYLRFTTDGRRANMMARMAFMRDQGVITDQATGNKLQVEFRPCVVVGRDAEGRALVQLVETDKEPQPATSPQPEAQTEKPAQPEPEPAPAPVAPTPAPSEDGIPDIGELLSGLQETRKSIDTIDSLLAAPDALLTEDDDQRRQLRETIASTKDKALAGLEQLNTVLARAAQQTPEELQQGIHQALTATIEAMISFDDMSDQIRDGKRHELEALRKTVESYFAKIDPNQEIEAYRSFSAGVNKIILSERKETLEAKTEKLEKNIEKSYDTVISSLQKLMRKGTSVPLIPHPRAEPSSDYAAKIVLNMIHIAMAVRYSGLSIALDIDKITRRNSDIFGWDASKQPRIYIVDASRYRKLCNPGSGHKDGLRSF